MAARYLLSRLTLRTFSGTKKSILPNVAFRGCQLCMNPRPLDLGLHWHKEFRKYVSTGTTEQSEPLPPHLENPDEGMSDVLRVFSTLKMKKTRLGFLNCNDIQVGIEKLKDQEAEISSDDFLQLLELTAKTVESDFRDCSSNVQQLWELYTQRKDNPLTFEHLKYYFQLCLHAEVPISLKSMLKLLEDHDIQVNRELLEIMMSILGRNGRLEETTDLLTIMKRQGIPLSETIFSAIILAYGFSRDLSGLPSVLDTMRSVQVEITSTTFHALMTAYAVNGDFPKVKSVTQQMREARVTCSADQLKALLLDLVTNGEAGKNFENMEFIVSLMNQDESSMDLSTVALRLIHRGHLPEAIRLLSYHPPVLRKRDFYNNARIYIREMVHCIEKPEMLVAMCQQLQKSEINQYALLVALETALIEHREEVTWALLEALKDEGRPLRPHYFWPLFAGSRPVNSSKLISHVKNMITLDVPPDAETLREYIIPNFVLDDPCSIELMLKDAGLKVSQIAVPLLSVLISSNMIDEALNYAKTLKAGILLFDLTASLARVWSSSPQSAVALLALLITKNKLLKKKYNEYEPPKELEEDWGGQFLLDIVATRAGLNKQEILPLFKELRKNDIGISESAADHLVARVNETIQAELQMHFHLVLNKSLGHPPREQDYGFLPHPKDMNTEELEDHLLELQAKRFKTKGTIRRLILRHASENNSKRVLELMKDLETEEKISPGILSSLLTTYISVKNVDAAMNVYQELVTKHPSFMLDQYKVIDFCRILVENGDVEVVSDILEEGLPLEGNINGVQKQVRRNCWELLMAAAKTCNYEATKQIFNVLKKKNIIKVDNLLLGPLVKCHLNNGNLVKAVAEVKSIAENYKCVPLKVEVLIHLLHNNRTVKNNEDGSEELLKTSEQLMEEMLNIIASIYGNPNAHHDLLFACLEAGYPSQASQVLKSIGRKIDGALVRRQCQRYAKNSREEPLLHFLRASKSLHTFNRGEIYNALLNVYRVQNNGNKGLSLWMQMQDDDIMPSKSFLKTLANLLESNAIKIPFEVSRLV